MPASVALPGQPSVTHPTSVARDRALVIEPETDVRERLTLELEAHGWDVEHEFNPGIDVAPTIAFISSTLELSETGALVQLLRAMPGGVQTLVVVLCHNPAAGIVPASCGADECVPSALGSLALDSTLARMRRHVAERRRAREAEDRLRDSEARYRLVTETASDAIVTIDDNDQIIFANPAADTMFGYAHGELAGRPLSDLIPSRLQHAHSTGSARYRKTGARNIPWRGVEIPVRHRDGSEIPVEISFGEMVQGGKRLFTGTMRDVTERNRILAEVQTLANIPSENPNPILRLSADGALLYANPAARAAMEAAGPVETERVIDLMRHEGSLVLVSGTHSSFEIATMGRLFTISAAPNVDAQYVNLYAKDVTSMRRVEGELAGARALEVATGARIHDTLLGGRIPYDAVGVSIAAESTSSEQLGGDFYDFHQHGSQFTDVLIGDVMGKGVAAALLGAATRTQFARTFSNLMTRDGGKVPPVADVVTTVHRRLTPELESLESFATVCYARLDLARCQLTLVDCGHPPILHLRASTGTTQMLQGTNLPLGFDSRHEYSAADYRFERGDIFVFYSDGVTEAANEAGELFGAARLAAVVVEAAQLSVDGILAAVNDAVQVFAGCTSHDDRTCVVVRVERVGVQGRIPSRMIRLTGQPSQIDAARRSIRDFCGDLRPAPSDEFIDALVLAIYEALANVVTHGYGGHTDQPLWIEVDAFADAVSARIYHAGSGFKGPVGPLSIPDLATYPEHGFGLFLMATSVDSVRYTHDQIGRQCIQLIKRFASDFASRLSSTLPSLP